MDSDEGNSYSDSVPRHTLPLLAAQPIARLDVSLGYCHIDDRRWIGGDHDTQYIRPARDWKIADGRITKALVLQSLFGGENESLSGYLDRHQGFDQRAHSA